MSTPRPNYEKTCNTCIFHVCVDNKPTMANMQCTRPRCLVTGRVMNTSCVGMRTKQGPCGYQGHYWQGE